MAFVCAIPDVDFRNVVDEHDLRDGDDFRKKELIALVDILPAIYVAIGMMVMPSMNRFRERK